MSIARKAICYEIVIPRYVAIGNRCVMFHEEACEISCRFVVCCMCVDIDQTMKLPM